MQLLETGITLGVAMSILLKVLLFQLSGRGNSHDNATPKVIPDSNSCILGLSNEVSFVSGFQLEGGQNIKLTICLLDGKWK